MAGAFSISCFETSVAQTPKDAAVVVVDVFRATTTAVTCAASGRRVFLARDANGAHALASRLSRPLLIGETAGVVPDGFDVDNSPAELAVRRDVERPAILISSSGVPIMLAASEHRAVYAASLRNTKSLAEHLACHHDVVRIIGAGTKGQFREEDQLGCAWLAAGLLAHGYVAADPGSRAITARWADEPVEAVLRSASANWLFANNKDADVAFVLEHVNDLSCVLELHGEELVELD